MVKGDSVSPFALERNLWCVNCTPPLYYKKKIDREQISKMKQNSRRERVSQRVLLLLPGVQEALQKLEHQIVILQTQNTESSTSKYYSLSNGLQSGRSTALGSCMNILQLLFICFKYYTRGFTMVQADEARYVSYRWNVWNEISRTSDILVSKHALQKSSLWPLMF